MKRIVPILVILAVVATGCTGDEAPTREELPAGHGGTLRVVQAFVWFDTPSFYDPQTMFFPPSQEVARCCLFRTLMSYNGKQTNEGGTTPRPDIAASEPSVSSDGLTWTFRLRSGIHYAPPLEGVEIAAQDIVRGIERGLAPAPQALADQNGCQPVPGGVCSIADYFSQFFIPTIQGADAYVRGNAETISGLRAPDPLTLQVKLTHPSGSIAYLFALPMSAPIPSKPGDPSAPFGVAAGHALNYGDGFAVGSGPYMFEGGGSVDYSLPADRQALPSGATPDSFVLVRNPSWDPATDDLRVAYADRIEIVPTSGDDYAADAIAADATAMVDRQEADVTFEPALVDDVNRYRSSPELSGRVLFGPTDFERLIAMNLAVPPLDDLHVRRAVNFAIDKTAIQQVTLRYGSKFSDIAAHTGIDSQEGGLLAHYAPYGDGSGDLVAAHREIAASPYDRDHDGVCDAAACRGVALVARESQPDSVHILNEIARDLAPLGIRIRSLPVDDQTWYRAVTIPSASEAMLLVNYYKDYPDAWNFFFSFFDSSALQPGDNGDPSLLGASRAQLERWGFPVREVPNVDERMARCDGELFAARVSCWAGFDQYLTENVAPWVPLLSLEGGFLVSSRVTGFSIDDSISTPLPALDRISLAP